jgi:hypothetical protein
MGVFPSGRSRSGMVFEAGQTVAGGVGHKHRAVSGLATPLVGEWWCATSPTVFVSVGGLSAT